MNGLNLRKNYNGRKEADWYMLRLQCGLDWDGVPCVNAAKLEQFSEDMLGEFSPEALIKPQAVNVELFSEQYLDANLEIRPLTHDRSILGVTVFNGGILPVYDRRQGALVPLEVCERTIMVEQGIYDRRAPGRYRYTVAHEAAHLACHSEVKLNRGTLCRQSNHAAVFVCRSVENNFSRSGRRSAEQWLEWQAEYMAGALLMPKKTLYTAVDQALFHLGKLSGSCGWEDMRKDPWLCLEVARYVSQVYQTSVQAAQIRIRTLEAPHDAGWIY